MRGDPFDVLSNYGWANPTGWPLWMRRGFVLTVPVSAPLLLLAMACQAAAFILLCVLALVVVVPLGALFICGGELLDLWKDRSQ